MSPEHFFDFKMADRQSDIYSLGKILYEAIDGQITSKILPFKRAALSNPDTPFLQKLNQIIQDATSEEKGERLKSVGELRNALLEALDILKRPTTLDIPETPRYLAFLHRPGFIWAGIVIAIVSMTLMGLWHLMGEPGKTTVPLKTTQITRMDSPQSGSSDHLQAESTSPAQSILGKDGNTMLFVPGGELEVSVEGLNGQRQTVQIQPFYLDEKMVTNHHFAEFLNEVKDGLTIEKGVVKNNKEIWFYLGKGTEPHEQIIYEHERFHLRNIDYAAHPAVRVTWYGAIAYARHYGKRLATEYEWDFAALGKYIKKSDSENRVESPLPAAVEQVGSSETHMMHMVSPSEKTYNLEGIGDRVKEWITKTKDYKDISYPSLVTESFGHVAVENKRFRYPWEAFSDVGFRCVLNTENVD